MQMSNIIFPYIACDVTIGIDNYSFSVKKGQPFHGIVNIPVGVHVVHFQNMNGCNGDEGGQNGIRYGFWFNEGDFYVVYNDDMGYGRYEMKYDIFDRVKYENQIKEYKMEKSVVEYPKVETEGEGWYGLSEYISWDQIRKFVVPVGNEVSTRSVQETPIMYVDTSMISEEENKLLEKTLSRRDDKSYSDHNTTNNSYVEYEFRYTPIKFKSKEAIRNGYEMVDFNDKENYLNKLLVPLYYKDSIRFVFSELEFSYLNGIMFGNYGSSLQWHTIIELICHSSIIGKSDKNSVEYIEILDKILSAEVKMIPGEYIDMLINESMWGRCLDESYQGNGLVRTRKILMERKPSIFKKKKKKKSGNNAIVHGASPDGEEEDYDDDDERDLEIEQELNGYSNTNGVNSQYSNHMLPSIDGTDTEDEDGPVVVETIQYK